MAQSETVFDWLTRAASERVGFGIVVAFLLNRGEAATRAEEHAEEALQEAYLRAATRAKEDFQGYKHFANWIRLTARHICITGWRRTKRERPLSQRAGELLEARGSRECQLLAAQLLAIVRATVSANDRQLLEMMHEGLTLEEMAGRLNSNVSAVRRTLQRLLSRLRQQVLEEPDPPAEAL